MTFIKIYPVYGEWYMQDKALHCSICSFAGFVERIRQKKQEEEEKTTKTENGQQ